MPRDTSFSNLWLQTKEYLGWVQKKNESTAYCTYCAKDINISNMGEAALVSHMEGKKHRLRAPVDDGSIRSQFSFPSSASSSSSSKDVTTARTQQTNIKVC